MYYIDKYSKLCEDTLDSFIRDRDGVNRNTWANAPFDWMPGKEMCQSELKTRYTVLYDDYPDLIINGSKIREAKKYDGIFVSKFYFWFQNGDLYEWVYNSSVILEMKETYRNDRDMKSKLEPRIPRELLKFVKNIPLPLPLSKAAPKVLLDCF
jgi:hypothetical protein